AVYVRWLHGVTESNAKETPDTATPLVNGQVVSLPALQASMSMFSLAPATRTFGWFASTARAGSFCLFCEKGDCGLPVVTKPGSAAPDAVIAPMSNTSDEMAVTRIAESLVIPCFPHKHTRRRRLPVSLTTLGSVLQAANTEASAEHVGLDVDD